MLALAAAAGAPGDRAGRREWGGFTGYFADPDGFRLGGRLEPRPIGVRAVPDAERGRPPVSVAVGAPAYQAAGPSGRGPRPTARQHAAMNADPEVMEFFPVRHGSRRQRRVVRPA